MLFTDICSLYQQSRSINMQPNPRWGATDSIDTKLRLLVDQWRDAYPEDKEFKCPDTAGLCFDSCLVVMEPAGMAYYPAPEAANCDEKLPSDHPCIVAETRHCARSKDGCYSTQNLLTFARCGGVTGHLIRGLCETQNKVLDHWEKTPTSTR